MTKTPYNLIFFMELDKPRTPCPRLTVVLEATMDWNQIKGNWNEYKGKAKEKWGNLTDDELDVIAGKRDQLVGRLQQKYGLAKDEAERQADDFANRLH